jgi:hypothetical protein
MKEQSKWEQEKERNELIWAIRHATTFPILEMALTPREKLLRGLRRAKKKGAKCRNYF